ncbi:MAG: tetratricopeptide repeat protein [Alphaproteobacteria bacterium]|nr:tetratricopeptide repeat protein [Alphaproteobacteria bacterium]
MSGAAAHEGFLKALAADGDGPWDVAGAALALAAFDHDGIALDPYRDHLAGLARATGTATADGGAPAVALARALAADHGYSGDRESYEDMQNADLIRVIDRRRGLPVALAILYLDAARRQGWDAVGLAFPYHFLIRVEAGGVRAVIDPFHDGAVLGSHELRALLKRVAGKDAELERAYFEPVTDRDLLIRLENNIKSRALREENFPRAAEIVRRMLLFAPDHVPLWRDASVTSFRLGEVGRAVKLAEEYFIRAEDSVTRNDAARLIQKLQRNLN